ncbi:TatD family hydrolase [Sinomicrobium soli]|uniref:TatD family hydrolase n=1 Tax=Sinomicrobium sp. N-1-3-6 TaxID=2219864 RepID=UPI000DCB356D|nr:TatD family hydrolase [Sinomicrobium sp. N-1-3-6]RAV27981.1 hydrolase TatD [Sinomicrobium sp. N-1-3-6]
MIITDTHTHLYSEAFDADRDEMIQRAIGAGVERFFIPAIDSSYTEAMLQLERRYPGRMFLMAGLHPTHVGENFEEELAHVAANLERHRYYAVGEIGIDLYWDRKFLQQQQEAFRRQVRLAREYRLPIVIHCREAFDEVFEILESEKGDGLYGIFHCFTGTEEQAEQAISYGMKLGIGGVVTFKNGKIDRFLDRIPLDCIVLETDAPYLAPVPFRGKRNESAYLVKVLEKISEVYGMPEEEVALKTTANAAEVFGI